MLQPGGLDTGDVAVSVLESKYAALDQLLDEIAAESSDSCTDLVVADLAIGHERAVRRMESIGNRRILDVSDRDAFRAVGNRSLGEFVRVPLRVTHPKKRIRAVQQLEALHSMTGEVLAPRCPDTAAALASGAIGADHVDAVIDVMAKIPAAVDPVARDSAERLLADFARTLSPREIIKAGVQIVAHLDPDGELTDDRDRARQRKLSLGPQDAQLMSTLSATLDPVTRALFDVVLAAWAAPGLNNPDDDHSPRGDRAQVDADVLREAADRDCRSQTQRNHDALTALLRTAVDGGLLGSSHRGLPPHIIISITDTQLRHRAGVAHTATGADLPITDVLTLAAQAQMHLAVFDEHTGEPLFLGRAHRLASQAQRFMAFIQYGGCSAPNCPVPFAHTEMHHADTDWADGGKTDATHLAPACGPHNRAVGTRPDQWTTTKIADGPDHGLYGWRRNTDPPDHLRVNDLHRIDALLARYRTTSGDSTCPENDPWHAGDAATTPPVSDPSPQPDPWDDTAAPVYPPAPITDPWLDTENDSARADSAAATPVSEPTGTADPRHTDPDEPAPSDDPTFPAGETRGATVDITASPTDHQAGDELCVNTVGESAAAVSDPSDEPATDHNTEQPPVSGVEHRLALLLVERIPQRTFHITWPNMKTEPA